MHCTMRETIIFFMPIFEQKTGEYFFQITKNYQKFAKNIFQKRNRTMLGFFGQNTRRAGPTNHKPQKPQKQQIYGGRPSL